MDDIAYKGDDVVNRSRDGSEDDPTGGQTGVFLILLGGLAVLAIGAFLFFAAI